MMKGKCLAFLIGAGLMTGAVAFADSGVYEFADVEKSINENNSQIVRQMADTELLRLQKESLDEQKDQVEGMKPLLGSLSSLMGSEAVLQLLMVTDYLPDQLDSGIVLSDLGVDLARNGVILGARQLVLGIMQTQQAMRRAGENLENQEENWKRALLSYDKGLMTESDKLAAGADLEEARLTLDRFAMDNKDYVRRLNQLMGKPLEATFVFLREQPLAEPLKDEATYVSSALENRFEIVQLEESLDLKDNEIALYEIYGLKDDPGLKSTYRRLIVEREQVKLQLTDARAEIAVDVKIAYRQAVAANQQRIALTASRDAKRTLLSNLKVQREVGFVSDTVFDATENALKELEEGVDLLVLQYNTSRMALDFASKLGPGLGSGVTP